MVRYTIYADGQLLFSSDISSPEFAVSSPRCTLALGEEGSAEFTILPTHYLYQAINRMRTRVQIYRDDTLIFSGRVVEKTVEMDLQMQVTCEGDLALLLDSIMGPYKQSATVRSFIEAVLANHNEQVDDWKQFRLGDITIEGADTSVSFDISGYSDTKSVLTDQLTNVYGGYFATRTGTVTETKPNSGEAFTTTLKSGSSGAAVKLMQQRLIQLEYSVGSTRDDGQFGSATAAGLRQFQTEHDLTSNGIYDKETHNALLIALYGSTTTTSDVIFLDYLADPYYTDQADSTTTDSDTAWTSADFLQYGSQGEKVRLMQERLITLYEMKGWSYGGLTTSGYFDESTQYYVSRFQDRYSIKRTMTYNQETHMKLISELGIGQTEESGSETETTIITPTLNQEIRFGSNIIEMSGEYPISDVFTVLLPLGANDINISSVNDGSMYLENAAAIKEFGRIVKTYTWSKATTAQQLKEYAEAYLKSHTMVFPDTLTITVLDLNLFDRTKDTFTIGSWVRVVSSPHRKDDVLCCLEMNLDLQAPENDSYRLGYYIPFNFDSDTSERVSSTSGNISRRV